MKISLEKPDHVYWDIVKGIGLLCVVIGHSWMRMQNFVYSFLLQVVHKIGQIYLLRFALL